MKLKPIRDQVIVRMPPRVKRIGSIIVPETVPDEQMDGAVVAVGPAAVEVEPGDVVVFRAYAGADNELEVDGQTYRVMYEDEILAVEER